MDNKQKKCLIWSNDVKEWIEIPFQNLNKDDIFKLYESDGKMFCDNNNGIFVCIKKARKIRNKDLYSIDYIPYVVPNFNSRENMMINMFDNIKKVFRVTNDLNRIDFNIDNLIGHTLGLCVLSLVIGVWDAAIMYYMFEILQGFMKDYRKFKPKKKSVINFLKENLLYSDGFSLQDAVVFNPLGVILYFITNQIIKIGS